MTCLFVHRWSFDFRLHYVYRKCQFCNAAERKFRNRMSMDTFWEPVVEPANSAPEPRQLLRKRSLMLPRWARSLGSVRVNLGGRARTPAPLT
jgi:hypothetical protein